MSLPTWQRKGFIVRSRRDSLQVRLRAPFLDDSCSLFTEVVGQIAQVRRPLEVLFGNCLFLLVVEFLDLGPHFREALFDVIGDVGKDFVRDNCGPRRFFGRGRQQSPNLVANFFHGEAEEIEDDLGERALLMEQG
jgi:hypothetical protein